MIKTTTPTELHAHTEQLRADAHAGRLAFGPWRYDPDRLVLVLGRGVYEVDIEDCSDSARALDWLAQVAGKVDWTVHPAGTTGAGCPPFTVESLGWLLIALDTLLSLQATLCPGGHGRTLDAGAYLRAEHERTGAGE